MRLGIYGYGNLGKAAELCSSYFPDIDIYGVFTRRDPSCVRTYGAPVFSASGILEHKKNIDVLFIAGGSATDLPVMTPDLACDFNVIDSFDNHSRISEHFKNVNRNASESGHLALISAGWDPGLFSIARVYLGAILPEGRTYTFWGRGVSQGHSDAIRRIDGVIDARQYTVPKQEALEAVKSGACPDLDSHSMHRRECYVAVKDGVDKALIEKTIKEMPSYFSGYETDVNFVTPNEIKEKHSTLPHGGQVIRNGMTGQSSHSAGFSLALDSNPEFTASVILAYSRAVFRMYREGRTGCISVLDVPPKYISVLNDNQILESCI